jgi:hypothetical protein
MKFGAEWFSLKHRSASTLFLSSRSYFPSVSRVQGVFTESAKACQHYFCFYCKIFWKLKRETVEALCGTFGGVRLLASLFARGALREVTIRSHGKSPHKS